MFNTLSITRLEKLLNEFSVPMFVNERDGPNSTFRITGVNAALEELAGMPRNRLLGRCIMDMAASGVVADALEHYQRCVSTRQPIRFPFLFLQEQTETCWDKILQYARSPEGYDRVIATAIRIPYERPALQDRLAFEDVRYFSTMADLQLENLSNAFDTAAQDAQVQHLDTDRFNRLQALCRTVQSTVGDIKQVVRAAQARHKEPHCEVTRAYSEQLDQQSQEAGYDTVNAIANASDLGLRTALS